MVEEDIRKYDDNAKTNELQLNWQTLLLFFLMKLKVTKVIVWDGLWMKSGKEQQRKQKKKRPMNTIDWQVIAFCGGGSNDNESVNPFLDKVKKGNLVCSCRKVCQPNAKKAPEKETRKQNDEGKGKTKRKASKDRK